MTVSRLFGLAFANKAVKQTLHESPASLGGEKFKKMPNGYGSVVKLSGKRRFPYAARITTSWSADGKQVKKYLGCFKTRQDAYKALADFNDNPFDLETKKITFAQLFERWQKVKYKDSDFPAEYSAAYKKLAPLYNVPFADIRKRHIQMLIDNLKVGHSSKVFALCFSNMRLI